MTDETNRRSRRSSAQQAAIDLEKQGLSRKDSRFLIKSMADREAAVKAVSMPPAVTAKEQILRSRKKLILHSYLYYRVNDTILSDARYDQLTKDLARLQNANLKASSEVEYSEYFHLVDSWKYTGFHLAEVAERRGLDIVALEQLRYHKRIAKSRRKV